MAKAIIPAVKGTRDFYPNDMAFRSWLYRAIRNVSESFGYQEYDGPFIEKVNCTRQNQGKSWSKRISCSRTAGVRWLPCGRN